MNALTRFAIKTKLHKIIILTPEGKKKGTDTFFLTHPKDPRNKLSCCTQNTSVQEGTSVKSVRLMALD